MCYTIQPLPQMSKMDYSRLIQLYELFYNASEEKMHIEQGVLMQDKTYEEKLSRLNDLKKSLDAYRRNINILKNK